MYADDSKVIAEVGEDGQDKLQRDMTSGVINAFRKQKYYIENGSERVLLGVTKRRIIIRIKFFFLITLGRLNHE